MLKEILFKNQSKKQLTIAVLGVFIGFIFLLIAVHYYVKTNNTGEKNEILSDNLLIVQKKISKFNALGLNSVTFSKKEIEELKALPFIKHLAPIINNQYKISLGMRQEGLPYFRTDIFLQSVDKNLIDAQINNWKWQHSDSFIPLVMPRDFMVMLNQFAASYNMPQVSEDLAKTITFRIDVRGNDEKESFDARIIGFSNQIGAVLVPTEFMQYANKKYGNSNKTIVSQVMVAVKTGHFGDLTRVFNKKHLESKKSEMVLTKVKSILSAALGLLIVIGLIIIVLSAFIIMQYAQLLISKSSYEINVLMRLGYHPNKIAKNFLFYFIKMFGILALISSLSAIVLTFFLDQLIAKAGLSINHSPTIIAYLSLITIATGIVLVNYWQVKQTIVKKIKIVK